MLNPQLCSAYYRNSKQFVLFNSVVGCKKFVLIFQHLGALLCCYSLCVYTIVMSTQVESDDPSALHLYVDVLFR